MKAADDVVEAVFTRVWAWCRRHWGTACLSPWAVMALWAVVTGQLLAGAVYLTVATVVFYVLAKLDAIEKDQSTPKG